MGSISWVNLNGNKRHVIWYNFNKMIKIILHNSLELINLIKKIYIQQESLPSLITTV